MQGSGSAFEDAGGGPSRAAAAPAGLALGPIRVGTPLVLAPMAGVTDVPFRRLCRRFAEQGVGEGALRGARPGLDAPGGLFVCEMVTARALLEGHPDTLRMVRPDPRERVRSIQLYGVDPDTMAQATRLLVERGWADHIDLNFGCPVPKVTRKGGGAALPWKRDLFEDLVGAVVRAADAARKGRGHDVPVTVKMRVGIDDAHETYLDAARIAQRHGVAGIGLHARTQAQYYSGHARWEAIARLREQAGVPVFGNGDVFDAEDARRMLRETGCDAVVIGRGCEGRPWLFREIAAALHGRAAAPAPGLRDVARVLLLHARWTVEDRGDELRAMQEMRKHVGWYLRGFAVGGEARHRLSLVRSLDELRAGLERLDLDQPFPPDAAGQRGRAGSPKQPRLPDGWLDSRELTERQRAELHLAEVGVSGG